ncbi:MAG: APC family permease [Sulfobacillus sp.]|nr:APC family permease [Sulfobacillus sp.]
MTIKDVEPTRRLRPVLRWGQVLAIAVAAISPTTSVFLVYGAGLSTAGTGIVWAFLIGAVIALSLGFSYAELGGLHPGAGGAYRIIRNVLGEPWGLMAVWLFLVLGMVITASILVAAATYLNSLVPGIPVNWAAVAMMALVTVFSLERIGTASWVATVMLIIELTVIGVFILMGFLGARHGVGFLVHPQLVSASGRRTPVMFAGLMAAVVPALFAFNGYDWPLYFAEETYEPRKTLPRAVMLAVAISIGVEVLAVIAATVAIPDLSVALKSSAPLSYVAQSVAGPVGATILIIGVIIAMFDTGLSGNLAYARIYYDSAQSRSWPEPVNRFFGRLNRHNVPQWGFLLLGIGNAILCYFTSLNNLITFTGVVLVAIYLLIATAAIVSRVRQSTADRPFRMPLWPIPPIIAIIGAILALTQQSRADMIQTAVIVLVAVIYWAAYARRHAAASK